MKILYAIQGTGNGHLSRARDIVPILSRKAEVDILVSGSQADVELPVDVTYRFKGLSFIFGKQGGVDLFQTYKKSNLRKLLAEIESLPIDKYDLVISDFEPVSSWACYIRQKPCISLSHQAAVLNEHAPQPDHIDPVGKALLKYYAPFTAAYGFHFKAYDEHISTPVIRQQVRDLDPSNKGHYTVYLPAYDDKRILKVLSMCGNIKWQVFSKHNKEGYKEHNVSVFPINNDHFLRSMADSAGVLCGAGFETPAEAMFLGKKLLVIPMKKQYEQYCNAAALMTMGVPVLKSLKRKHIKKITRWLEDETLVTVDYPDTTEALIDHILESHAVPVETVEASSHKIKLKHFREISFKRILHVMGIKAGLE